ncbi:protease inhibitor I42 family protein [Pelolinea submarina]|uniref:Inhibitor of cysteine peptidase n=1 Tax=Pelolinea submarina TaxID=913107 RepID=A0A347ZVY6_9CHLR|nr:protease inhibitor I42 family protein [Pelolinea submarina]REG07165.1 inhibitor of cysteine peptidase [Pelolinea submarina]BBB49467.1 inhibitor of cysteine peptidase [Pelolinea submarina]
MNRNILWIGLLLVCLAGCQSVSGQLKLTEEDSGKIIEVKTGETFIVSLKGNITTGYNWSIAELDDQYLQQQGEAGYESDSDLIGAGGTATYTFKALKAGQTTLKLVYNRPFEPDNPPEKTFEISVVIK